MLIKYQGTKTWGRIGVAPSTLDGGEFHVAAAFAPEAEAPVRILQAAGWSLEEV
jgi:hypothetical protein